METETKTQAAQSPAPGAESAPAQTPAAPVTQAAPEIAAKPPVTDAKPAPKGEIFFNKRESKRVERIAELEKENNELKALKAQFEKNSQNPETKPEPISFMDDPDKWAANEREKIKAETLAAIDKRDQDAREQASYVQAAQEASKFILTRSHLKEDPNAKTEIAEILKQDRYAGIADFDPHSAYELAYVAWCRTKGVVPDLDGLPKTSNQGSGGKTSAGVSPSAPAAGERTWNRREAEAYLMESTKNPAQFKSRSAEIEKAKSEGRVK